MGYFLAMGPCVRCGQVFSFNPVAVPSISIDGAPRRPICAACVAIINQMRIKAGTPPIVPLPDAYEGCDESELD